MSDRTFHISTSCQNIRCSEEISFPIDMLRWWKDKPICEECFNELNIPCDEDDLMNWHDLEPLKFEEARP